MTASMNIGSETPDTEQRENCGREGVKMKTATPDTEQRENCGREGVKKKTLTPRV